MMETKAKELYERLVKRYGCDKCKWRGDNGCGVAYFPDGHEFWSDENDEPEYCEYHPEYAIGCFKEESRVQRVKDHYGVSAFESALNVALSKAPTSKVKEDSYGDIVRSAAAVAVAALGKLQMESEVSDAD